ncbi:MAG TPA: glucokinase [Candidatus Binataceae bacterium]|nr:glucokinase [Candidatus Binataceae bacterium]
MILAGDIGGTKTILALFEPQGANLRKVRQQLFPSPHYPSLEAVLKEFLGGQTPSLQAACFGIAGAVIDGRVHATNLHWEVSEAQLVAALGISRLRLLNDLAATAYGMPHLAAADLEELNLQAGARHPGNIGVIAAGTGLGEAMLYWDGQSFQPQASEGGHADFAPREAREIELLRYLQERLGQHISYERVLSGPGLLNIYDFLRDRNYAPEPPWLQQRLAAAADRSVAIAEAGLDGSAPLCEMALEMFASLYGAEAGNLALRTLAVGGIYIGGGIAPKLMAVLRKGAFIRSFVAKGRFESFLRGLSVQVALTPEAGLIGAAHYALSLLGKTTGQS